MLKEQIEVSLRENGVFRRAIAIQHERQKEHDDRNQEVQQLKQMIAQYQEQIKNLEVKTGSLETLPGVAHLFYLIFLISYLCLGVVVLLHFGSLVF